MTVILRTFFVALIFVSCGGESKNSDAFSREEERIPEPPTLQRLYRGDVRAVNPAVVSEIEGQVSVRLVEDDFNANIVVSGVPLSIHPQRILTGKNCPDEEADTDGDGVISMNEAAAVSGSSFIPLDDDLGELAEDVDGFPDGGILGAYTYDETTSREQLLADLGPGVEFDLENRVIMIYGTVLDNSLPIGCSELIQVVGQP